MERRQVQYFLTVVDHGGFTAAAKALYVAQPSLSYAIKALEKELGAELFHRLPGGVRLTAAGEALVGPAREILRAIAAARESVEDVVGGVGGHLELIALPSVVMDPLGPAIAEFRRRHPRVTVRLAHAGGGEDVLRGVRTRGAEIGFTDAAVPDDPELESVSIGQQEMLVAMPPGSPAPAQGMSLEQLVELPLLMGAAGGSVRQRLTEVARRRGVELPFAAEVANRESLAHLVVAGAGSAVLPEALARLAETRGAVIASLSPRVFRGVHMVRRKGSTATPAGRRFQALVLASPGRQLALADSSDGGV